MNARLRGNILAGFTLTVNGQESWHSLQYEAFDHARRLGCSTILFGGFVRCL